MAQTRISFFFCQRELEDISIGNAQLCEKFRSSFLKRSTFSMRYTVLLGPYKKGSIHGPVPVEDFSTLTIKRTRKMNFLILPTVLSLFGYTTWPVQS